MQFQIVLASHLGDTLLAADTVDAQEELVLAMSGAPSVFHMIFFECVPEDSVLWKVLDSSKAVRQKFWVYAPMGVSTRRLVQVSGTFPEYLQSRSAKTRKSIRRSVQNLKNACNGNLTVQCVRNRSEIPTFLNHVHQVSTLSWQGKELGAVVSDNPTQIEQLGTLADRGWLRSYVLYCSGEPVAFVLGWQADGIYYYEKVGYDPAWAKLAPGIVLLYHLLADIFATDRPRWLDFRYGDTDYKKSYSTDSFTDSNVYLVRKTPYATCVMCVDWILRAASRVVRTLIHSIGLTGTVRRALRRRPKGDAQEQNR